jgi:hypothetical protein
LGVVTGGFFDVDTGVLRQIADDLETAAGVVSSSAPNLAVRPDAGQSSGEVGTSLTSLSEAVTALGQALSEAATSLSGTADDYDASDLAAQETLSGPGVTAR